MNYDSTLTEAGNLVEDRELMEELLTELSREIGKMQVKIMQAGEIPAAVLKNVEQIFDTTTKLTVAVGDHELYDLFRQYEYLKREFYVEIGLITINGEDQIVGAFNWVVKPLKDEVEANKQANLVGPTVKGRASMGDPIFVKDGSPEIDAKSKELNRLLMAAKQRAKFNSETDFLQLTATA